MKQNAKICAIGETECNEICLYLRRTKNCSRRDGGEGVEGGLRKGAERG